MVLEKKARVAHCGKVLAGGGRKNLALDYVQYCD